MSKKSWPSKLWKWVRGDAAWDAIKWLWDKYSGRVVYVLTPFVGMLFAKYHLAADAWSSLGLLDRIGVVVTITFVCGWIALFVAWVVRRIRPRRADPLAGNEIDRNAIGPKLAFGQRRTVDLKLYGFNRLQIFEIQNIENRVDSTARNVSAKVRYRHADSIDVITVERAGWFSGDVKKGFHTSPDIESGGTWLLILAIELAAGSSHVTNFSATSIGEGQKLKYGRWTLDIHVSADNCALIETTIELSINRDGSVFLQGSTSKAIKPSILESPKPSNVELWIEPDPGNARWFWRLRNRELTAIGPCSLLMMSARSYDSYHQKYREEFGLRCSMGTIELLEAGDFSQHYLFARLENSIMELGDMLGNKLLWPTGDESLIHKWQLEFHITGLKANTWEPKTRWTATVWIEWAPQTKELSILQYSNGLIVQ